MLHYEVTIRDLTVFAAYLLLAIVVPGTLLWRALAGARNCWFAGEVAAGTVLGFALEVLTYLPARAVGMPLLVGVWPVVTLLTFLAVPGLRRHWRGPGPAGQAPWWWSWSVAIVLGFLIVQCALTFMRFNGLSWPGYASPYVDTPDHLALIGELRHHMPPTVPYVSGEPLHYHWFVYAELAASSWMTGIEPMTLFCRFSQVSFVAVTVVGFAYLAGRIAQRSWAGPVALVLTVFSRTPHLYGWNGTKEPIPDGGDFTSNWLSPTQTFGTMLCIPIVLLLADLLRGQRKGRGAWLVLALLLCALTGAKATYLPLLLAGLAALLVVRFVIDRRVCRPALGAAVLTGGCLAFAQLVLYGGASQGLRPAPFASMTVAAVNQTAGLIPLQPSPPPTVVFLGVLFFAAYACLWAGLLGLLRRPSHLLDPVVLLVLGMGLAGVGAMIFFGHPAHGQFYFLKSSRPYLTLAAVCGLTAVFPVGWTRTGLLALAGMFCAGLAAPALVAWLSGPQVPARGLLWAMSWPWLALAAVGVLAALAVRVYASPGIRFALLLTLLAGFALANVPTQVKATAAMIEALPTPLSVTQGALKAGRWLRDHSGPDDLVATNTHCRYWTAVDKICENRHFWVSAFTERRVLVEGWGNTDQTSSAARLFGPSHGLVPFWDRSRLTDNDAAFQSPSVSSVSRLHERYGVRWLFVDWKHDKPASVLRDFVMLRFRAGDCAIYEIRP
jgi:hypothetical protein